MLATIVIVSGASDTLDDTYQLVESVAGGAITEILLQTQRAHRMMGQLVSSNFQSFTASCGDSFDPACMDDINKNPGNKRDEVQSQPESARRVLCATELGLQRWDWDGEKRNVTVVINAKVALDTMLDELASESR